MTSELRAHQPPCRFCGAPLRDTFVDLGMSPLCQRHLRADQLGEMEPFYPLHAYVCRECFLVQIEEVVPPQEIFGDGSYAYFSSYADSWLRHAAQYTELVTERFGLGQKSFVVEVASNDGYLLQNFVRRGIPVLGIEPAANTAEAAVRKGVPTLVRFFGAETAKDVAAEHGRASLLLGNNVLAHVPDLNDFVAGLAILLAPDGVLTMEFPHLLRLVERNQFDTIYHEHFSYLSFGTVARIFARHGLEPFDVDELDTHGGSLRVYARHAGRELPPTTPRVARLLALEERLGMRELAWYASFGEQVKETKRKLLAFLIGAKRAGKSICGYGAPGKGNTLLNYCGVGRDFLDFTVDRSPYKQGKFLPGTHIPILHPDALAPARPDYVLILPWNLKDEIATQLGYIREWGGRCVVPIPTTQVL